MHTPDEAVDVIVDAVRGALPRVLVALDFDGTLAPIVTDPAASRPAPGTLPALVWLAERGATVAVITGRDAATAVALGGLDTVPGIVVAGLYGAQWWRDGRLDTAPEPEAIAVLRARLPGVVAGHAADPGVWIEDKGLSLVVHARSAADPAAALAALRPAVTALADGLGLAVHDGRAVLEVRLPGHDKGGVLRRLVEQHRPDAVLFAGDDLGDLPAFEVIRELRAAGGRAWAVAAVSPEAPEVAAAADALVDGPAGVVAMLAALTAR